MKKERLLGLDLARAICAVLIVLYHYRVQLDSFVSYEQSNFSTMTAAGNWSITVVSMFFAISAIAMIYNHPTLKRESFPSFYYKRWKGIIPIYLLVWFPQYIIQSLKGKNFLWGGSPFRLILTLFGLDGYFSSMTTTYYTVGEWFLGVIILLYALYPLLLWFYRNHFFLGSGLIIGFYILNRLAFDPTTNLNFSFCLLQFWLGAMYFRFRKLIKSNFIGILVAAIISGFLGTYFLFVPILSDGILMPAIAGFFYVIFFDMIGDFLMKLKPLNVIASEISGISFEIFLIHHYTIGNFLDAGVQGDPLNVWSTKQEIWIFLLILFVVLLESKAFNLLKKWLLKTPLFLKLDSFFMA